MCRVLIATQRALKNYDRKHGIINLLDHLEMECGGHGNVAILAKGKKVVEFIKGLDVTIADVDRLFAKNTYDYALFHTRIASVSSRSNDNCHPYVFNNSALAMNGTEYGLSHAGKAVDKTDSELIFDMVKDKPLNYTSKLLSAFSSVFVGFVDGKPYAFKNGGELQEYTSITENDFLFASSFPHDVKNVDRLFYGFSYINGQRSTTKPSAKPILPKFPPQIIPTLVD